MDEDTIAYFKAVSKEIGILFQSLINLYRKDCAATSRKPNLDWK